MDVDAPEPRVALDSFPFVLELQMMVFRVKVLLATSEVDHENFILFLPKPNQEVGWFNIIIDQSFGVNPFDPFQDLIGNQQDSLEGECPLAVLEQLFKRRPVDIRHERAVIILDAVPIKIRDADSSLDNPIKLGLSLQRRVLQLHLL